MEGPDVSIVKYSGASDEQRCSYCGSDGSRFHGMWSDSLNVRDYQDLLDRGWKRYGHFFFKPTMDKTCCPQYTIRMDAINYKLSKSQKRVLKRMNKYLIDGDRNGKSVESQEEKAEKEVKSKVVGAATNKPVMRKAEHIHAENRRQGLSAGNGCETVQRFSKSHEDIKSSATTSSTKTLAEFINEPDKFQKSVHKFEEGSEGEGPHMGYGTFHQHYILDGKLIAVGVLDILPYCVLSVYLYYLPEYRFLSIGTYTALREIAFLQELNKVCPDLKYYYMGYYIHSCPKVTYKSHYSPSFLLCPETYTWIPVAECISKLDIWEYSRLATEGVEDKDRTREVDNVPVLFRGQIMTFGNYRTFYEKTPDVTDIMEYVFLVGSKCAQKLLFVRN